MYWSVKLIWICFNLEDGPARLVLHKLEEDDSENPELTKSVYWLGIVLTKSVCEEIKRDAMKLANECKKGQVVVFYFEYPLL